MYLVRIIVIALVVMVVGTSTQAQEAEFDFSAEFTRVFRTEVLNDEASLVALQFKHNVDNFHITLVTFEKDQQILPLYQVYGVQAKATPVAVIRYGDAYAAYFITGYRLNVVKVEMVDGIWQIAR